MIKQIKLENFKCIKDSKLDLNKINISIGPNGNGKSSIAQSLLILKQSISSNELSANGNFINFESFTNILDKETNIKELLIGFLVELPEFKFFGINAGTILDYQLTCNPKIVKLDAEIGKLLKFHYDSKGESFFPRKIYFPFNFR